MIEYVWNFIAWWWINPLWMAGMAVFFVVMGLMTDD